MSLHYATANKLRNFKVAGKPIDFCSLSDTELEENLALAETIIESYVMTIFYSTTRTVYFNGNGNQNLYIAPELDYPIISVTSCTEVDELDNVLRTFEEPEDYVIYPWFLSKNWARQTGRLQAGSSAPTWPRGCRNVKVVGAFGRAEVPVEVARACVILAAEMSIPGSSGLIAGNISKREWEDFKVQYKGQLAPSPSDSTGFEFVDRLLDKWRISPSMFLTPEEHLPSFTTTFANVFPASPYPLN